MSKVLKKKLRTFKDEEDEDDITLKEKPIKKA